MTTDELEEDERFDAQEYMRFYDPNYWCPMDDEESRNTPPEWFQSQWVIWL